MAAVCKNILQAERDAAARLALLSEYGVLWYAPGNNRAFENIWNMTVVETGLNTYGTGFTTVVRNTKQPDKRRWRWLVVSLGIGQFLTA